jgi:undecaprenyl-diphosphatase
MRHPIPTSTAFPSGHSAAAAAFATGVALEAPWRLVLPVAAVAGAVAFSRIYVGAHYPGDVAAGLLLGTASALVTRIVWPTPPESARTVPFEPVKDWHADHPGSELGKGLVVIINKGSGTPSLLPERPLKDYLADELPFAEIVEAHPDDDLFTTVRSAAAQAKALAVAGGDGTVGVAVRAALEADIPLLVIPAGTLNHFSRALGMETPAEATAAYRRGRLAKVDVGSVDDGAGGRTYFVNNAGLGVYPDLVHRRESMQRRLGKWPALAVAAAQVLRHAEPQEVVIDGHRRLLWMAFVGNGVYASRGALPSWRTRLDEGVLDVRVVVTGRHVPRLRAFAAVILGHLHLTGGQYRHWTTATLRIARTGGTHPLDVTTDGEVTAIPGPLEFTEHPARLSIYRP